MVEEENEKIKKIQKILRRIFSNIELLEQQEKISLGRFKSDVIARIDNCTKLLDGYLSEVHRVGKGQTYVQKVWQFIFKKKILDLYRAAINHPSLTRIDSLVDDDGAPYDLSPAWIERFVYIFVMFQNKPITYEIDIYPIFTMNLGENVSVVEKRKTEIINSGKLCGLKIIADGNKWITSLSDEMSEVKKIDPSIFSENIKSIPIISILTKGMEPDASSTLTYTISALVAWLFFIFYISNHSDDNTRIKVGDIMRSSDTSLMDHIVIYTSLDYLIDIIGDFGRIVSILLYGNDDGFYPSEEQIRKRKSYRSKITLIPLKLVGQNLLFSFTKNGIKIDDNHPVVQLITGLRISITP